MSAMYLLMSLPPANCKLFLLVAFELYYHGICLYALIYSSGSESEIKTSSNVPPEKQNTYLVFESALLLLFRVCIYCGKANTRIKLFVSGSFLRITQLCGR